MWLHFVSLIYFSRLFLATMSFAGYFHVRFLMLDFLFVFSPTVSVPSLFWFGSFYLVATARLVGDQLM